MHRKGQRRERMDNGHQRSLAHTLTVHIVRPRPLHKCPVFACSGELAGVGGERDEAGSHSTHAMEDPELCPSSSHSGLLGVCWLE